MSSAGSPNVLGKLSYVLASRQREKVLAAVVPRPQTPGQIAKQTGLHLSHVSRTLGELSRTDLITCLSGERRGKLYAASNLGHAVFAELADSRGDRLISPIAYAREYNHGRLEVDVQERRAVMRNYDWMSSPARCAARLGGYEGTLTLLAMNGTVTKVACMLRGAPYCGYRIDW